MASLWWLVISTLVLTIGELYLSPIGLSFVTKIAPARMISMLMGVWFLTYFGGNYLCGFIGMFWEKIPKDAFFLLVALLSLGAGIGIFAVLKPLKRAIRAGGTVDM